MPITPTYPGVYIQEKASGVHPIIGVATSITAFVGRTQRGPDGVPTVINSLGDFERKFGGLDPASRTSYAVRDFFLNGGSQAIIVRLFHGDNTSTASLRLDNVELQAASKGKWGAGLRATVDTNVLPTAAAQLGVGADKVFSLKVRDVSSGVEENFENVTLVNSARRLDNVLRDGSQLVRWKTGAAIGGTTATPLAGTATVKSDDLSNKSAEVDTAAVAWRDAANAVTQAKAEGKTPAELAPLEAALSSKKTALEAKQTTLREAVAAFTEAIADKPLSVSDDYLPSAAKTGLHSLDNADLFNLLCLPPDTDAPGGDVPSSLWDAAAAYCAERRAMLLVDPPKIWTNKDLARQGVDSLMTRTRDATLFFPRLLQLDPSAENREAEFVPCGAMAGLFARTDTERGVWKAPAGIQATIRGLSGFTVPLTDAESGELNPIGVNCLRELRTIGRVCWGARTLRGADALADEYKYIPIRRLALFIEESLFRGTQWVVFEPNDEPLWAQIRLNVGAFMNGLFRQGAFQGQTPRDAYLVKCDREVNPQSEVDKGIVNILVGFAPLKPAEFVVIKIQQLTARLDV